MKLFNKIVNQNAYAYYFYFDEILFLINFAFDCNAIETQNIFINLSIQSFYFLTKYDIFQQIFI